MGLTILNHLVFFLIYSVLVGLVGGRLLVIYYSSSGVSSRRTLMLGLMLELYVAVSLGDL